MTQTIGRSRRLTVEEARGWTARLISECPTWCTVEHDPTSHPEDISHRAAAEPAEPFDINVINYPIAMGDSPTTLIYVAETGEHEGDFTRNQALALASAITRAVALFDEVTA